MFAVAKITIIISSLYDDGKAHQMRQTDSEDKVKSNEIKIIKMPVKDIKLRTEVRSKFCLSRIEISLSWLQFNVYEAQ
jgi:hypothetical protein